uniref:Uncharacterized protein n=1 Tax=viral metagenome TaxID=1070528 RepID=A0A6M3KTP1_9ZZZZ
MITGKRIKKAMQITRDYKADLETHKEVIREQESQIAEKDEYILKANMEYTYYAESLIKEIAKQKKQIATLTGQLEAMEYTTIQGGIIGMQKERIAALTALINDNERAEKVASPDIQTDSWNRTYLQGRREAISDYLAMLKAEMEGGK